jgi:hypothetical protein
MRWMKAWFGKALKKPEHGAIAEDVLGKPVELAFLRNSFDDPLPSVSSDVLLDRYDSTVVLIYRSLGLSQSEFDRLITPVLRNLALKVQLLPASESHHHRDVGGLLLHSLQCAAIAARLSLGRSFCGSLKGDVKQRSKIRWPVAVTIAALLHDVGKVISDLRVLHPETGAAWRPFAEDLYDFAMDAGYLASWQSNRAHKQHECAGAPLALQLLTPELLDWLGAGETRIIPAMIAGFSGQANPGTPFLHEIVCLADRESVSGYRATGREVTVSIMEDVAEVLPVELPSVPEQATGVSTPASEKLMELLPELFASGRVVVNRRDRDRGVFWVDSETGVAYATWPQLFNFCVSIFENAGFSAYPRTMGQFHDSLALAGFIERISGEYSAQADIKPDTGRAFRLSVTRVISPPMLELLKRYNENRLAVAVHDLGIILDESEEPGVPDQLADAKAPLKAPIKTDEAKGKKSALEAPVIKPGDGSVERKTVSAPAAVTTSDPKSIESSKQKNGSDQGSEVADPNQNESCSNTNSIDEIPQIPGDSEDIEILNEVGAGIFAGRIPGAWLVDGCLCLAWPDLAKLLGEEPEDVLSVLVASRRLARKTESKSIDVKPTGLSRVSRGGKSVTVLALTRSTSSVLTNAFQLGGLDSCPPVNQKQKSKNEPVQERPAVASPENKSTQQHQQDALPESEPGAVVAEPKGDLELTAASDRSEPSVNTTSFSAGIKEHQEIVELLMLFDAFLVSSPDCISRLECKGNEVLIPGFPELFLNACKEVEAMKPQLLKDVLASPFVVARKKNLTVFKKEALPRVVRGAVND